MSSIDAVAEHIGVSSTTVLRALRRHGIPSRARNRNRRPSTAAPLDDAAWLADRYRTHTAVEIARDLGVSPRTVYAAMARQGIPRRSSPGVLPLRRPVLVDRDWLLDAVNRTSSTRVAAQLGVSSGTVRNAYVKAGIDPSTTATLFDRGRPKPRPSAEALREVWQAEGTHRGVGRRIGVGHNTAAVWLAEIGIFANDTPVISRQALESAIAYGWSLNQIATHNAVATHTVRIELLRHGLFEAHRQRHRR